MRTRVITFDQVHPHVAKHARKEAPEATGFIVNNMGLPESPGGVLELLGVPVKQRGTQVAVYLTEDGLWVRLVTFTPFTVSWHKVTGLYTGQPQPTFRTEPAS